MDYFDSLSLDKKKSLIFNNINTYLKNITGRKSNLFSSKIKLYNFIKRKLPSMAQYWKDKDKIRKFNSEKLWNRIGMISEITTDVSEYSQDLSIN